MQINRDALPYYSVVCVYCRGTGRRRIGNGVLMKRARLKRGWSLRDVAGKLDVSHVYISDMETGRRKVSENLLKLYGY